MNDRNLRDELLALQQTDPQLQAEYDRRIREMMEVQLRPAQRVGWGFSTLMGIALSVGFGWAAIVGAGKQSWQATVGFALASLVGLAWAVLGASIVRKGRMTRDRHPNAAIGLVWAFTIAQFILIFNLAGGMKNTYNGTWMMLGSLGYLVMGVAFLIANKMEQSALKTEEQILRLQLRMEQLASGKAQEQT